MRLTRHASITLIFAAGSAPLFLACGEHAGESQAKSDTTTTTGAYSVSSQPLELIICLAVFAAGYIAVLAALGEHSAGARARTV